jgi:hypothetical protein
MEDKTIEWITTMAKGDADVVDYWHLTNLEVPFSTEGKWVPVTPPTVEMNRVGGVVHEGACTWVGNFGDSVIGMDFRPHGIQNVYVTGGIFPWFGS